MCKARGRFREREITPMVGDRVIFSPPEGKNEGYLLDILPRDNQLKRPVVSNVDRLVAVISAEKPLPDLLLVDRLLVDALRVGADPLLVINKTDVGTPEEIRIIANQYMRIPVLPVSACTGQGMDNLTTMISGSLVCLAGQSGVGKTSLINSMRPDYKGETAELSLQIGRGRQTTRHVELIVLPGGGWIVDTPGFSLLEPEAMDPGRLKEYYPEFTPFEGRCRFADCRHDRETGCAVRQGVGEGRIHPERYNRYVRLLHEIKDMWRNRYESS